MKKGSRILVSLATMAFFIISFSFGCGSDKKKTAYFYIPGATFHQGNPPASTGSNKTKKVVATPSSSKLSVTTPVDWHITWDATLEVESVLIYHESVNGYFEVELTDEEVDDGMINIVEKVAETKPSTDTCAQQLRHSSYCAEEVPQGTTDANSEISFVGSDNSVGTYIQVAIDLDYEWAEQDNNGGDGDATCSGAETMCGGCTMEACCTSSQCWYIINGGQRYYCASMSNCTGAAQSATDALMACCGY